MKIAPCSVIREAERHALTAGKVTSAALMDAVVGRVLALDAWREGTTGRCPSRVVAYLGKGNNAGDAVGIAARMGCPVSLRCACPMEELSAETLRQLSKLAVVPDWGEPEPQADLLILDGLLGSGARGELRREYAALVEEMNTLRASSPRSILLALDVPTGLDADSGSCHGPVALADFTAAIGCVKPGMLADGAEEAVGQLLGVALPEVELPAGNGDCVLEEQTMRSWLPRRPFSCYKNRVGHVAVIAGSVGMLGAARLCAEAVLQAGAGLVTLYSLPEVYPLLATSMAPEVMIRRVSCYADADVSQAQALLIGPGLGHLSHRDGDALEELAHGFDGTVILDADGLNLAAAEAWSFAPNWVLTPHPGEMRRLDFRPSAPREEVVRRFLEQHDCTLLLKGARSLIANRQQRAWNSSGGPFMANGGQGDVLAGVIAALAAQGLSPWRAAAMGAYACGRAASLHWQRSGYVPAVRATDTLRALPEVLGTLAG